MLLADYSSLTNLKYEAESMLNEINSLVGKVALVTGASSGLGDHFSRILSQSGATVVVAARRQEKLATLVEEVEDGGGKAFAVNLDITSEDSIADALKYIEQEVGPIDILVNNAGVANTGSCLEVKPEDWDFVMDTNLKGVYRMATLVAAQMIKNEIKGSIINISSILGLRVGMGQMSYATSKAGVVQMTKSMALELGSRGVRSNALCPGYFLTEINDDFFATDKGKAYIKSMPARRLGKLDELNGPLLLLASDAGSFVNGVALPVDGGHLISSL